MIAFLLAATASGATCIFTVDGAPTTSLDCTAGGAWRVSCPLPAARSGKVRYRLEVPARGLEAEARVSMARSDSLDLALMGPRGRAGSFLVERAAGGLLPGQAVGPMQLCPIVQPGVKPGSPPARIPLIVTVTEHQQTGFAEEKLHGGVVNRVPVYDAGVEVSRGEAVLVQPPVEDVPILQGAMPLLRNDPLQGSLSIRGPDNQWRNVGWSGTLRDVLVDTGDLVVATMDFVAPEVEVAMGPDDAVQIVETDLELWLAGDPSSRLALVAWARSELKRPTPASFEDLDRAGRVWRRAELGRAQIWVHRAGERLRVVIAHRAAPLDDAALEAIEGAASAGL